MLNFTSDQWVIVALIFLLGLLVGGFLFSGGGRKWKQRYNSETERRRELERTHADREKEWREQDSLRGAALKDRATHDRVVQDRTVDHRPLAATNPSPVHDGDRDGVDDRAERPTDIRDARRDDDIARDRDNRPL